MRGEPAAFEAIWRALPAVQWPASAPARCVYAERFQAAADELTGPLLAARTALSLNQAKVVLVDLYLAVRAGAPRAHRDKLSGRGHACCYQALIERLEQIQALALTVQPPVLAPAKARPRHTPAATPVLYLGEPTEGTDG